MKILFVDDEPNVLSGLRRMLRSCRNEWDMEFACGGEEALERLAAKEFDVVVSDMKMPGMDGLELLTAVRYNYPSTVRIILSGQSDQERVIRSVGPAHRYLHKPCDAEYLISVVKKSFKLQNELADNKLSSLVAGIGSLPSLPKVYTDLQEEIYSENASVDRIGSLVSQDMAMSAKILQLVNSSFFGLPQRVNDPTHAVSLLGIERIKPLVLMAGVFCQFQLNTFKASTLTSLTEHSLQVGMLAKEIASQESTCEQEVEDAYIAGMLHDIGMLVLMSYLSDEYQQVIATAESTGRKLWEVEQEVLGTNHAMVGAYLLNLWGLPNPIVEAVAWHHRPESCIENQFRPLTAVHVANQLVAKKSPLDANGSIDAVCLPYLERLGLAERLSAWQDCVVANVIAEA